MGLKEILAAKKAAAEKETNAKTESTSKPETQTFVEQASSTSESKNEETSADIPNTAQVPQNSKPTGLEGEVLVDANGKPLSGFALVKRRKELAAQAAQNPVKIEDKTVTPTVNRMVAEGILQEAKPDETGTVLSPAVGVPVVTIDSMTQQVQEGTATETGDFSHPAFLEASPETKQAYSDLKVRIDSLVSLADIDLKNAMTELKKALMQNTNAVALMLPSDIGQMVIALRKMTGVELAKAEEKKTGKKTGKKEPALTAEELENAFKEL